jgi:class 3 adenylate cyclase
LQLRVARPLTVRAAEALFAVAATIIVSIVLVKMHEPYWHLLEFRSVVVISIAFVACGGLVFLAAGQRANGILLVASGFLLALAELPTPGRGVLASGLIALSGPLLVICLGTVFLRYPDARVARPFERWFLVFASAWVLGFEVFRTVVWPFLLANVTYDVWPSWLPFNLGARIETIASGGMVVVYLGFVGLLIARIIRTRGLDRRVYIPIHVASVSAALVMVADAVAATRGLGLLGYAGSTNFLYIDIALLAIPFLLIISTLQRRLMRLRIASFITQIRAEPTPRGIESALRKTLADPRLTLHFWSAENDDFVNVDGICSWSDEAGDQMVVDLPGRDGSSIARVLMDRSAAHHSEVLEATKAASGLALENAALQVSLLASLDQVRESRQEGATLSRLLPTGLAEILRRDGARVGETERLEVTVLMSDVRGYSAIAEQSDPSSVAGQLNTHRREMNRAIIERGGTVMQYVGDAVMAVFGAPVTRMDHADRALAAASAMHVAQLGINEEWEREGLPMFGLGIGLSTGEVAAALLGSDERIEYTLVGDTVNLANRLQDLARPAGTIVLSESTWRQLTKRPEDYEELPTQLVKGRRTPVTCYRVRVTQSLRT